MKTLTQDIQLKIHDYSKEDYGKVIKEYSDLLADYMNRENLFSFVHAQAKK